jgi:hypothetical protein
MPPTHNSILNAEKLIFIPKILCMKNKQEKKEGIYRVGGRLQLKCL